MSLDMDLIMAASEGDVEWFACEDHEKATICSKCIYKGFKAQNELFNKNLTESDIGHRCYIPREHEGIFFSDDFGFHPNNEGEVLTMKVTFYDMKEKKPCEVLFRQSTDQRSYLTQWKAFAEEKELREGDVITFYKLETKKGTFLLIGVQKKGYIFGEDFTGIGH